LHRPFVDAADLTPAERESWSLAFDGLLRNYLPSRIKRQVHARRPRRTVRPVTTDDGLERDETAPDAVGLPAIPVSAGALIFDRAGRLILKPTYKSGWTIPGGVLETDGETPGDAGRREVAEELGLHIDAGHPARLACMDFRRRAAPRALRVQPEARGRGHPRIRGGDRCTAEDPGQHDGHTGPEVRPRRQPAPAEDIATHHRCPPNQPGFESAYQRPPNPITPMNTRPANAPEHRQGHRIPHEHPELPF
jgi:ADP-ribose pyrophosphatase YjhB (NUDIX family)